MNPELVDKVRNLKLAGLSSQQISEQLGQTYSRDDILSVLSALQYTRPAGEASSAATGALPSVAGPSRRQAAKAKHILIVIGVIIGLAAILHFGPPLFAAGKINSVSQQLKDAYAVDKVYDAGQTSHCTSAGPTEFGQITGVAMCRAIVAKIFYPKVKTERRSSTSYLAGSPVQESEDVIFYVGAHDDSFSKYFQLGTPIKQFTTDNPYDADKNLGLEGFDHVVFAGLEGASDDTGPDRIAGKWAWDSEPGWLRGTGGVKLQADLTRKIESDQAPVHGAPTATQALSQGRAPLVALIMIRYCHSPDIVGLDRACILPN